MGDISLKMIGDWKRAGIFFKKLSVRLQPAFEAELYENGQLVLKTLQGHIDKQDLKWTPLSERTVELKGGDTTIYVDTGTLRNGLVVRRIKSSVKGSTIFVGASPWKRHESGVKMSDLMIWLEYGTDKIPPRPLIAPTKEEVEGMLHKSWKELMKDLIVR